MAQVFIPCWLLSFMRIIRKKRKGIKIEHNRKLFWLIILLIALLAILILFSVKNNKPNQNASQECIRNEDCAPATCCHPSECAPAEKAPSCRNIMCSMVCSSPLDCGAGKCGCVKGACEIIPNK